MQKREWAQLHPWQRSLGVFQKIIGFGKILICDRTIFILAWCVATNNFSMSAVIRA
jgi:hypothetical protein